MGLDGRGHLNVGGHIMEGGRLNLENELKVGRVSALGKRRKKKVMFLFIRWIHEGNCSPENRDIPIPIFHSSFAVEIDATLDQS